MPRVSALMAFVLVVGIVAGWLLGIGTRGLAQDATPTAAAGESGPAHLGGDLPGDPQVQLIKVAAGFDDPVNIAFPNDGSGRIFVLERAGLIRVVEADGTLREEPFLDLSNEVTIRGSGEQGLLGMAFHPDYATNGRFYVDYNSLSANNDVLISEFQVSAEDPNAANPRSERLLMRIERPFATHSGGTIRFDADGYLFIAVGDGGQSGDPYDNAQNRFSLLGKLLRIDVDGGGPGRPYGIPPDNPFVGPARYDNPFPGTLHDAPDDGGQTVILDEEGRREREVGQIGPDARRFRAPVAPEIWALGLRQPWSFSFDAATGDVYIGDVGAQSWEEINFWPAGTAAGLNYGWDWLEGAHCYPEDVTECPRQQVGVLPVAEYAHDQDGCAVIALGVYRGEDAPDLDGVFLNADYCNGSIRGLARDDAGQWVFQELLNTALLITSGHQDETGTIYVVGRTLQGATEEDGGKPRRAKRQQDALWRLVPADQVPPGAETVPLGDTGGEGAAADDEGGEPAPIAEAPAEEIETDVEETSATPDAADTTGEEAAIAAGTPTEAGADRGDGGRVSDAVTIESFDIFFEPDRVVIPADTDARVTLPNLGATPHNFSIDELDISVDLAPGETQEITINAPAGRYDFYCNVPGHLEAGMEGRLIVR